ncbi:NlpC/P60 family protein [Streptomyces sp. NPDC047000]|uniref:C40 family peptidase n=1 Tax=Streptomyces sp. NPDC047000 TaxID=3155474 RepID=UPI0033DDA151
MSGRLPRLFCTAALAVGTALAPRPATAAPDPGPPERPGTLGQLERPKEPGPTGQRTTAELLTDLHRLYQDVKRATQTYDGTSHQLAKQRAEVERLQDELARARLALRNSRNTAGRLARQQYQAAAGGVSPYVRLLLARDPQRALDEGHVIGRLSHERAAGARRLATGERRTATLARASRAALDRQLSLAGRQQKDRDAVRAKLADVEALLAALTPEQLAAVAQSEKGGAGAAQTRQRPDASGAPGTSGAPGPSGTPGARGGEDAPDTGDDGRPSSSAHRAVTYALRQLGKPYVWGAQGPRAYDCSGLTSQAWAHAGHPVPRTSQQQWARLPRVPLARLRPGDLVVYFPAATHVALYIGGGKVVQAPRPGQDIKVSPLAFAPVLGAVRPDGRPGPGRH